MFQAGSGAITDSRSHTQARHHLRDGFWTPTRRGGGGLRVRGSARWGGGRSRCGGSQRASGSADQNARPSASTALLVRAGVASRCPVPSMATAGGRSNSGGRLAWMSRVVSSSRPTCSKVQPSGAARGLLPGVRIDVEVVVVLDQDTVLDDALDGPPSGVHPRVPDLHALRDPERRSLLRPSFFDGSAHAGGHRVRLAGGVEDVGGEDPGQRDRAEAVRSARSARRQTSWRSSLVATGDSPRDALSRPSSGWPRRVRRSPANATGARRPSRSAHRRTAWANSVGSSGWGCTAAGAGRTTTGKPAQHGEPAMDMQVGEVVDHPGIPQPGYR